MDPSEETSATAEPDMPPKSILSKTFTSARPQEAFLQKGWPELTICGRSPFVHDFSMMMKKGMARSEKFMTPSAMVFTIASKGIFK